MYKIIQLIIKYVKLAVYNELLVFCKEGRGSAERAIDFTDSDMQRNYYGGLIRAYSDMATVIQNHIRRIKEGGVKNA